MQMYIVVYLKIAASLNNNERNVLRQRLCFLQNVDPEF